MNKEEFITALIKAGYVVKEESGVVMVIVGNDKNFKQSMQNLKTIVSEFGYLGSYGIRTEHSAVV